MCPRHIITLIIISNVNIHINNDNASNDSTVSNNNTTDVSIIKNNVIKHNNSNLQAFQLIVLARYLLGVPKP